MGKWFYTFAQIEKYNFMVKYIFKFESANDMCQIEKSYKNDYLLNTLNGNLEFAKYEMNVCTKTITTNSFDVMEKINDFLESENEFANNYSSSENTLHKINFDLLIND